MKFIFKLVILSLISIPSILFSQITITQSDFTSIFAVGSTHTSFADTLTESINIGQPGGGNMWDFTDLTPHLILGTDYVLPSATPFADSFANANVAGYLSVTFDLGEGSSGTSESWNYYNTDDASEHGTATRTSFTDTSGAISTSEIFSYHYPPFMQYDFPQNFNDVWSVRDSSESTTYTEGSAQFTSVTTTVYNIHIDAWGTMIMPSGKTVEALRSREQSISTTYFFGIPIGNSISVHYYFTAKTGESLSILADSEDPPTSGFITGSVGWGNDDVTSVENLNEIPKQFSLKQNYPNPFNPTTNIEYSISKSSHVSLNVYDILGNKVSELVNETQSAGNYRYTFDGSGLTSGVYFTQLQAGENIQTKKMTLLK